MALCVFPMTFNPAGAVVQSCTVPQDGTITVTAIGGAGGVGKDSPGTGIGGTGGKGASIQGDFNVTAGDVLNVLVGTIGGDGVSGAFSGAAGGGGGGSFVWKGGLTDADLLLVAGAAAAALVQAFQVNLQEMEGMGERGHPVEMVRM